MCFVNDFYRFASLRWEFGWLSLTTSVLQRSCSDVITPGKHSANLRYTIDNGEGYEMILRGVTVFFFSCLGIQAVFSQEKPLSALIR